MYTKAYFRSSIPGSRIFIAQSSNKYSASLPQPHLKLIPFCCSFEHNDLCIFHLPAEEMEIWSQISIETFSQWPTEKFCTCWSKFHQFQFYVNEQCKKAAQSGQNEDQVPKNCFYIQNMS